MTDDIPAGVVFSTSTWAQPVPATSTPERAAVLEQLAAFVDGLGPRRCRVAIDGFTAAGKTCLGHELATALVTQGRPVLRATLDDFKRPWRDAHLYDRISGEGYYRNAFDLEAIRTLLVDPAAPTGSGEVALCSIDPITQLDHSERRALVPTDGVLVVDGVFAFRPELDDCWDLRIWVDIDPELSVRRGTSRDADMEGGREHAEALHRDRYLAAELLYVAEVDPMGRADVIVDNTDLDAPRLVRPTPRRSAPGAEHSLGGGLDLGDRNGG